MSHSISIIGAGVAGLSVASELVCRGLSVDIYEASNKIGKNSCSKYAGGMLAPFCELESAHEEVVTLGEIAADWWQKHTGLVHKNGSLVLALGRDKNELKRFAARTRNYHELDQHGIADLEPDLAGRFARGLFFQNEAHLDPRKTLAYLSNQLKDKETATFHMGEEMSPKDAPGDIVIDCRGFSANKDLPDLRGVKGEMLILQSHDVVLKRPVRLIHPRIPLYIVPRQDGCFMVGATMIESSERGRVSARSILELLGAAYALHPAFGEAEIIELGCDVRPAFIDNLPNVTQTGRIISVNGLYRHGFLLAPAMAVKTANMVEKMEGHYAHSA